MHALDLANFTFESAVFEARFNDAFRLWDHAGEVWLGIASQLPEIKLKKAEPRVTIFQLGKNFELHVEFARLVVVQQRPDADLERFAEVATAVTDNAVRVLQIPDFTRVGLRLTYWRQTETDDEAARILLEGNLLRLPATPPLPRDATVKLPEFVSRWETKTLGVMVAVRAQTRRINIDIPLEVTPLVEVRDQERHGILQDVDYYTKGVTAVDNIRARIWVDQASKAARKALRSVQED